MTVIADEIQAALNHSPRHKDMLAGAVRNLEPWDVHAYANILGTKCRELGITDFPNPYKPVTIEDEDGEKQIEAKMVLQDKRRVWATLFDAAYLNMGFDPLDPVYSISFLPAVVVEEAGGEIAMPDFDGMTKDEIVDFVLRKHGITLSKSWAKSFLIERAEEIERMAEEAEPVEAP